jgi:ABC-type spermidine/putrescine transport system permease subunit II
MSAVPNQYLGVAAGTVAMMRNLGMVLGIAISGAIFNIVYSSLSGGMAFANYQPEYEPLFMAAFRLAMISGGLMAGVGIIITFLRGPDKRTSESTNTH